MTKKSAEKFKLSRKDINIFCQNNQYATMMFTTASSDYVASRCCILNGLLRCGFVLSCQAIEKILKVFIFLETKEKIKKGHNPFCLKEKLKETKDYKLDKFDNLLKRLYGHYQSRYHDNEDSSRSKSSKELDEIDELWVHLIGAIPLPDEVKYRLRFFTYLFGEKSRKYYFDYYWAEKNNKALAKKIQEMKLKHKAVRQHLYSQKSSKNKN